MSKNIEETVRQQNNVEYVIRQERPSDFRAVENLTREAFWNVYRPGCLEHYVLHCYRKHPDFIPELSLVLEGPAGGRESAREKHAQTASGEERLRVPSAVGYVAGSGAAAESTERRVFAGDGYVAAEDSRREILAHVMFAWSEILVDPQDESCEEPPQASAGNDLPQTSVDVAGSESQEPAVGIAAGCRSVAEENLTQVSLGEGSARESAGESVVGAVSGSEPPAGVEPRRLRMMTFGPISVRPDMQRKGLGKLLLDHALEKARQMGAGCIAMCGNVQFYGKCGFVTASSRGIRYADDPDGDAPYFLIRELTPGFLDGIRGSYQDPAPYFVDEHETEEFDKQFPPKEKKVLPGHPAVILSP